jgi:hypothetical protein
MTEKTPEPAQAQLATDPPKVMVSITVAELLAKGEKVTQADLARLLATVSTFYTALGYVPAQFQGATNAPVPVEILAMVGEKLVGPSQWAKAHNAARADVARADREQLQRQADEVWRRNAGLSNAAVAKIIAPDRWDTVRRIITKPKK